MCQVLCEKKKRSISTAVDLDGKVRVEEAEVHLGIVIDVIPLQDLALLRVEGHAAHVHRATQDLVDHPRLEDRPVREDPRASGEKNAVLEGGHILRVGHRPPDGHAPLVVVQEDVRPVSVAVLGDVVGEPRVAPLLPKEVARRPDLQRLVEVVGQQVDLEVDAVAARVHGPGRRVRRPSHPVVAHVRPERLERRRIEPAPSADAQGAPRQRTATERGQHREEDPRSPHCQPNSC